MIHDDKTTEIVISTNTTAAQKPSTPVNSKQNHQEVSRTSQRGKASEVALTKAHWLVHLQQELSEDWTLRVLAALTILVLSLLVL